MRQRIAGLDLIAGGRRLASETTIQDAGGYVLVAETVVPAVGLAVTSCYVADLAGETAVSHMHLVSGQRPVFRQRVLGRLAGQTHARGCLLDHASQLRAVAAAELGETVVLQLDEPALERAEAAWRTSE